MYFFINCSCRSGINKITDITLFLSITVELLECIFLLLLLHSIFALKSCSKYQYFKIQFYKVKTELSCTSYGNRLDSFRYTFAHTHFGEQFLLATDSCSHNFVCMSSHTSCHTRCNVLPKQKSPAVLPRIVLTDTWLNVK